MALVAFAADKGSPGVTTTCVALAAAWPRRVIVADCDPAGGDLALRLRRRDGLPPRPDIGLLSLAAAARLGMSADEVWKHVQALDIDVEVLVGLGTPEQGAGLEHLRPAIAKALRAVPEADVFADVGRIGPATPSTEILTEADFVVLVTRPATDAVWRLRERLAALESSLHWRATDGVPVGVVVIAPARRTKAVVEIQEVLRRSDLPVRVLGQIALDDSAAATLRGDQGRRLDRSLLWRSARDVAGQLLTAVRAPVPA